MVRVWNSFAHGELIALTNPLFQGTFKPTDISGCVLWIDASQIVGKSDGNAISSWGDLSGNNHNLSQPTGSNQPIYKTNIQNGLPMVRFDGTNDLMSGIIGTFDRPFTYCMVAIDKRTSVQEVLLARKPQGADDFAGVVYHTVSPLWQVYQNGSAINYGTEDTSVHQHTVLFDINGNSSYGRLDRTQTIGNIGLSNGISDPLYLGCDHNLSQFAQMDFGELIIYNKKLSSTELTNVESYLSNKWATP